ncbi:tyrosine-type recombinase/integrase [Pseudomonas sp. NyZ704]|nr:tyrosine-type recombinase/integrase [Pseudomonas sp. NyZ704]
MNDQTKNQYMKLAAYYYLHHMNGAVLSISAIRDSLVQTAENFQPGYFRRLKNAIAFDLENKGHPEAANKIRVVVNPVTAKGSVLVKKPKPRRAKSFSNDDLVVLVQHLGNSGYEEAFAAVCLISQTGARPAELKQMRLDGDTLFIRGAKKTSGGRGADRLLTITDETTKNIITNCIDILRSQPAITIDAIRHRIRTEGLKLWPRRKVVPSMYSMRHQVGSNLKASALDSKTIAYIMGHQSTNSIMRYGDKRQGNARAINVEPAKEADLSAVRDKVKPQKRAWFESVIFRHE